MFTIDKQLFATITEYLKSAIPVESCGYLAGSGFEITAFFPVANRLNSSTAFSFELVEQFEAVRTIRAKGLELIGVVHSHPSGTAYPSQEDCKHADFSLVQLIVVPDQVPISYGLFHLADSTIAELDLNVH